MTGLMQTQTSSQNVSDSESVERRYLQFGSLIIIKSRKHSEKEL